MRCPPVRLCNRDRTETKNQHGDPDAEHGPVNRESAAGVDRANGAQRGER